ncbi:MAG: hypothetical protein VX614_06050 [Myxococcota bacterium]|nr:hypothetical protein [Myxococcota bacterium]
MSQRIRASAELLRGRLDRVLGVREPLLRAVMREARCRGARAYLVGGPVRDLLLGRPLVDVDVMLSDGLGPVAVAAAERVGGRAVVHGRFLTARVEHAGIQIDLCRARRESYPAPGSLPRVVAAEVEQDLGRRDFTIHAMALPLGPRDPGPLLDPFDGIRDLRNRRLRILHPQSFIDDPTRLLRASRYATRLGLRFEAETGRAFRGALREGALESVSGDRVSHELERTLAEERTGPAASSLDRLGLLGAVVRGWSLSPAAKRALRRLDSARRTPPWSEMEASEVQTAAAFAALLLDAPGKLRERALERLGFTGGRATRVVESIREAKRAVRWLDRERSPGAVDARLGTLREPALLLGYLIADPARARVLRRYAREWRHLPNPLGGAELRGIGLQGPPVGKLLRAARRRALDGRHIDAAWVQRWLARYGVMR